MASGSGGRPLSYRLLTITLFAPALLALLIGTVSLSAQLRDGDPFLLGALTLAEASFVTVTLSVLGVGLHAGTALFLVDDARTWRRRGADWQPSTWRVGLLGALAGWFAVVYYLPRRAPDVDGPLPGDWWPLVAVCVVVLAASAWPLVTGPPVYPNAGLVVWLSVYAAALAGGLLAIGLYYDSRYVSQFTTWNPDPVRTCAVATVALWLPFVPMVNVFAPGLVRSPVPSDEALTFVPVFTLLYGVYYLVRRFRSEWSEPA